MAERNPSPPRLSAEERELIESDNIGDTLFSKKWVLRTLMKIVEKVKSQNEESCVANEDERTACDPQNDAEQVQHDDQNLEEDFDAELCELWDMSMNKDVAVLLNEVESTDLLLNAILKSRKSRLTEICIGILGNMACHDEVCIEMMKNNDFVNIVTAFLEDADTRILVETTRLMHVGVSNGDVRQQWVDAIKRYSAIKHLNFIMENSLSVDLLSNCCHLVEKILDCCDDLVESWSDIDLVNAVCEAIKQTKFAHIEVLEVLLHILQLVSTVENGVQALVSCQAVVPLLCHFVGECGHDEGGIIVGRELSLMSSFSVLNVILMAEPLNVLTAMERDPRIMKILMGLMGYSCKIHRKRSRYSFSEGKTAQASEDIHNHPVNNKNCGKNGTEGEDSKVDDENYDHGNIFNEDITNDNSASANPAYNRLNSQGSGASDESMDKLDVHHQYFTVAVGFLKDILYEAPLAPRCVSSMLAPHHKMLQKIVHYSKRIDAYRDMVEDLVGATLSIPELSSIYESLSQDNVHQLKHHTALPHST